MKIQCSCGAKYVFEVTPEMLETPVRFVCSSCGLDASEYVNNLVRQELAQEASAATEEEPQAAMEAAPTPTPPQPPAALRVRIHTPAAGPAQAAAEAASAPETCSRHYGVMTTDKCYICSKPICPKCMELFGYVCSPLCKAKAASHGVSVPVFENQRSAVAARRSRAAGRMVAAACVGVVALLGLWIWYEWFGSTPKPIFSVRFDEPSYSGQSWFGGKDQIVFLHGDTLARHDLKQKKEIWSRRLVDTNQIAASVTERLKAWQAIVNEAKGEGSHYAPKIPSRGKLVRQMEQSAAAELVLRLHGTNIWVSSPGKLVRFDWDTGNPAREVPLQTGFAGLIPRGDELLVVDTDSGKPIVTHINLTTCETRTEAVGRPGAPELAATGDSAVPGKSGASAGAGLSAGMPGKDGGRALDPKKVAQQAQRLSYPAKLALPATLAVQANQERALAELNNRPNRPAAPATLPPEPDESSSLIPTKEGMIQVSVRLIESRMTQHSGMKPPPAKSALDGEVNASKTTEIANEILNEMQRARGGDIVIEDESRYQVTLRQPGAAEPWTGEVIGPPSLFPLATVNVLAANKNIVVFDKTNKKLWSASLSYNVSGDLSALEAANAPYGQGPCVEHKGGLFVFDQGVLTAFDLATGNARWRLPSVGITGLFFDDQDMIYVNTTTAGHDTLKHSRQIDISQKTDSLVLKLDSRTGKTLWSEALGGLVNYVSGKFIFTVRMYQPPEPDEDETPQTETGFETPPFLRIKRINPRNGGEMWEHFQQRAPLDVQFEKNTIRLVFKKEVQVLKFLSL